MRRRARFLRKARELAYRDLGGLVYNLHRFGQRNDALVIAKLTTLGQIDTELRTLEGALAEHHPVTVLREAGVTACPRCAAIHSGEDRFCPNCGLEPPRRPARRGAPAVARGPPQSAARTEPARECAPASVARSHRDPRQPAPAGTGQQRLPRPRCRPQPADPDRAHRDRPSLRQLTRERRPGPASPVPTAAAPPADATLPSVRRRARPRAGVVPALRRRRTHAPGRGPVLEVRR